MIRPGKPVFRYAFQRLVSDPIFAASSQIEYDTAIIAKAESDIQKYETELLQLKEIAGSTGSSTAWSVVTLGLSGKSAAEERAGYLLGKMSKAVEKVEKLEKEVEVCKKALAVGKEVYGRKEDVDILVAKVA
jgi:hypothetical protein